MSANIEKWEKIASNLPMVFKNPDQYRDVYLNGLSKLYNKDKSFREITHYFDVTLKQQLLDAFSSGDEFNLLGIGVGEGMYKNTPGL